MKNQNSVGRSQEARRNGVGEPEKIIHESGAKHQDSRSPGSGRKERGSKSHESGAMRTNQKIRGQAAGA